MIDLGYNLSKNEAEEVVNYFDKSGSGKLNYEHLIAKLQVSFYLLSDTFCFLYSEQMSER